MNTLECLWIAGASNRLTRRAGGGNVVYSRQAVWVLVSGLAGS